ncbi:MAG: tetratricopeptide repeat protein [Candidatus Aminicenantes bacterium]|nr:tetratricopeptide repeat protein [Candidatus Aminicenantes bacterium]
MGLKCPKCQFDNPDTQKFCGECGTQLKAVYAKTKTLRASVKDSTVGEIISEKYKLLEELGSGGMGVVYKAEQIKPVKRNVALKIIKLGMDTKHVVARFETERQALAVMDHPNIAKVFDGGATETGRPYFVMEIVRGLPITEYCDKHKLTTRERLELLTHVCQAIQHAHQKGVIHRDLKPSNILVMVQEDKPVPKIIDFGIAKAIEHRLTERTLFTEQGQLIGTPEYMSPEQAEMSGLDVDTRTDIYSLGVMLYELLVGVLPFDPETLRSASFGEIQRIIREKEPPKASTRLSTLGDTQTSIAEHRKADPSSLRKELKGDLDWITMRAMAKDRTQRYASASELEADIERYIRHEPVVAGPPSTIYRIRKYIKRHKVGVAAAALVILAILIGITGTSIGLFKAVRAEKKARVEAETAQQVSDFLVELFKVSDPSEARGNTVTAREILDKGADKIDRELKDEPLVRARLMNTMGEVYHSLGLYNDAQALLEKGLAIREQSLDHVDPAVAESLTALGNLFWRKGNYERARSLHERALEIRKEVFGPEHRTVASSLNNLANLLSDSGDYEGAKPLYERAVEIWEKTSGSDDTDLAIALNGLGLLLYEMGDYDEARPLYERSLAIYEKILGAEHPDLTNPLMNLGMLLRAIGEYEEARLHYERSLAIEEKTFGPEHPHIATTLSNLAILHATTANFEAARPLFERVLAINEKALGPEHPKVGSDVTNLGIINAQMGDFKTARPLLERGLAIKEKALGPNHPRVANDINNLASLLRDMGDSEAALPLVERALAIREKTLGPEHPSVASSLNALADVLVETGDFARVKPLFERALTIQEKAVGSDHADVATILNSFAEFLCKTQQYEEAKSLYEHALSIKEKALGADHPKVALSLKGLGELLSKTGKHKQAQPLFERALRIQEDKLGPDHPYVADTLEAYAKVLRIDGEKTKAAELEARAKAIRKNHK